MKEGRGQSPPIFEGLSSGQGAAGPGAGPHPRGGPAWSEARRRSGAQVCTLPPPPPPLGMLLYFF